MPASPNPRLLLLLLSALALSLMSACSSGPPPPPPGPSAADLAALEAINAALLVKDFSSVTVTGSSTLAQTITAPGESVAQTLNGSFNAQASYADDGLMSAASLTLTQAIEGDRTGTLSIEMVYIAGDSSYVRVPTSLGFFALRDYRDNWTDVRFERDGVRGLEDYNLDALRETINNPLGFTLTPTMIGSISEGPQEDINGTAARVISVEVNLGTVLTALQEAGSDAPFSNLITGFDLELDDLEAAGLNFEALQTAVLNNSTLTATFWIGAENNRLYRHEQVLSTSVDILALLPEDLQTQLNEAFAAANPDAEEGALVFSLAQESTRTYDFSLHGQPVTIQAPPTGS